MNAAPSRRIASLDAFRGLTIAAMILVNSPGNDRGYAFLTHSSWHGWTLADVVFPSFLAIMGVSLAISLGRRLERPEPARQIYRQVRFRGAVIFGLGLIISAVMADAPDEHFRWLGVLQRIAICYVLCSLIFLRTRPRTQAAIAGLLLVGYWLVMTQVPVPGFGAGMLTPEGNLASYFDRKIMGAHLLNPTHDPEGILSTFPALATALMGVVAGQWLRSPRRLTVKALGLLVAGAACAAAGLAWGRVFPINKNIWTSSFALFSGGAALAGLAVCYWLIEILELRAWARPIEVFGRNPLLSYFLSGFLYGVQEFIKVPMEGYAPGNVKLWLCRHLFRWFLSPPDAALAYALAYTGFCLALMSILHRKKIFLKI